MEDLEPILKIFDALSVRLIFIQEHQKQSYAQENVISIFLKKTRNLKRSVRFVPKITKFIDTEKNLLCFVLISVIQSQDLELEKEILIRIGKVV